MKFSIMSDELQKALNIIGGVIPSKSTLPILENFLFDLTGNRLRVTATDLDTTMAMTEASYPFTRIDPRIVGDADLVRHSERILFGSDFPNLPYPYEEERRGLWARDLPLAVYERIFYANARRVFRL